MKFLLSVLVACVFQVESGAFAVDQTEGAVWITLFDGKTLNGWEQRNGTAEYRVEDGAIVGRTVNGSPNSFLCTTTNFGDFELEFEAKVDSRLNSGVQIRSQTKDGPRGRVNGPQVEIEAANPTESLAGYLYGEPDFGWMTPDSAREPHDHFLRDSWNKFRVVAVGPTIKVWINNKKVSDLTHNQMFQTHPTGFIALQVHFIPDEAGPYEVAWRELRLRKLDDQGKPLQ